MCIRLAGTFDGGRQQCRPELELLMANLQDARTLVVGIRYSSALATGFGTTTCGDCPNQSNAEGLLKRAGVVLMKGHRRNKRDKKETLTDGSACL